MAPIEQRESPAAQARRLAQQNVAAAIVPQTHLRQPRIIKGTALSTKWSPAQQARYEALAIGRVAASASIKPQGATFKRYSVRQTVYVPSAASGARAAAAAPERAVTHSRPATCYAHRDSDGENSDLDDEEEQKLSALLKHAVPKTSQSTYKSQWKSWCTAANVLHLNPWRLTVPSTPRQRRKESRKVTAIAVKAFTLMKARSKSDPFPKPDSAHKIYLAARAIHIAEGIEMPKYPLVQTAIKAITRKLLEEWDIETFATKRKQPFKTNTIHQFFSDVTFPQGTSLRGGFVVDKAKLSWLSLKALKACLTQAGFRKAEVSTVKKATKNSKLSPEQFSRSALRWRIGGIDTADPTPQMLQRLSIGDGAWLVPRQSKADYDGSFWCDSPIWFPYNPQQMVNAASHLAALELSFPVRGEH